jgi:hypothetical protein
MAQLGATLDVSPNIIRGAWRSPRGRETARRMAFFDVEPMEFGRLAPIVLVYEKVRQDLFAGKLTPDQDEVCWQAVSGVGTALSTRKLGKTQIMQLVFAWKGSAGAFGWSGVAPKLTPEMRPAVAYLMGIRYVQLKRPADAQGMFQLAGQESPAGSATARLARQELDRLGKK